MTASQLLHQALNGSPAPIGGERCFFCGASCDTDLLSTNFRSDVFTGWNLAASPSSQYACAGCALAMRERVELPGYDKPQKMRNHSWIITANSALNLSKGRIPDILAACLSPPDPPVAITIAVSGQKHLICRTPVNFSKETVRVQFEEEIVEYTPAALAQRVHFASRIAAAGGKPSLKEPPSEPLAVAIAKYWADFEPLLLWFDLWNEPLSRLAAFLCPNMEACRNEYPTNIELPIDPLATDLRHRRVPPPPGGVDRPGLFG